MDQGENSLGDTGKCKEQMLITIKGELTIAALRQAIYEELSTIEEEFAVAHTMGATLQITPTNGVGDTVVPHNKHGVAVNKRFSNGPYKSAADEFKIK